MTTSQTTQNAGQQVLVAGPYEGLDAGARQTQAMQAALATLWDSRREILKWSLGGVLLGLAALAAIPNWYVSEAVLQIDLTRDDLGKAKLPISANVDSNSLIEGEARILRSRAVLSRVVQRLGLDKDADYAGQSLSASMNAAEAPTAHVRAAALEKATTRLLKSTAITNDSRSYLINISVSSSAPEKSATIANTIAYEYYQDRMRRKLLDTETAAKANLSELQLIYGEKHPSVVVAKADLTTAQERTKLALAEADAVRSSAASKPVGIAPIVAVAAQPLELPAGPSNFIPVLTTLLAGVAASALALWRTQTSGRSASETALEAALSAPCLGTVAYGAAARHSAALPPRAALRSICETAQLFNPATAPSALVITSPTEQDGRTQTIGDLANVLADEGRRTLLVQPNAGRASSVTTVDEAIASADATTHLVSKDNGRLVSVQWTHDGFGRPQVPFGTQPFRDLLAAAAPHFDIVVLDVPTETFALYSEAVAQHARTALIIASQASATAQATTTLARRLQSAGIAVCGSVLTSNADYDATASQSSPIEAGKAAASTSGGTVKRLQESASKLVNPKSGTEAQTTNPGRAEAIRAGQSQRLAKTRA
jgi:capsular polysaccharide biosynthesis protein